MRLILLGPPGVGKGTQAQLIAGRLGLAHIATGDMFREAVRQGTELGVLARSYMDRGDLVPDQVTIRMLLERIRQPDAAKGFMLDGFPRNLTQADALDQALAAEGSDIDRVLLIEAPDEELVRRLSGRWLCRSCGSVYHEQSNPPAQAGVCDRCGGQLYQREDDRPETVRTRLQVQKPPADLVGHYRRKGILREVNGDQPLERVTEDLLQALDVAGAR